MGEGTEDVPVHAGDIAGVVVYGGVGVTKVKIKSRNPTDASKPVNGGKASPVPEKGQMPERKKESFISVCVGIIKQDIREKIYGEKEVKMPESKESWEDWKGEL